MSSRKPLTMTTRATALIALALLLLPTVSQAQVSAGGSPVSFSKMVPDSIATIVTPSVDVATLLAEDASAAGKDEPYRFGKPFDVEYDLDNSGTWYQLPNGDHLWRLRIISPGAYSINLVYNYFEIPEGASFFVYNEEKGEKSRILGSFTSANNKEHKEFATAPVPGDRIVLEYYEPFDARFSGQIAISRIVHAYRDLFTWAVVKDALGYGSSGSCNNNVNCPIGEPWQNQKRAVAMVITSGGSRLCSGSMINNVREDQTAYFLTANHCLGSSNTWIFMFNYESPYCTNMDGPTYMTTQGSSLLAHYSTSDFALLELNEPPPDSYQVYFAGWSALDVESDSAVAIHHPRGDIKKITFDYDQYTSTDYLAESGTSHWRIGQWEDGTTEPGSSGSPLFNKYHQIIGQLHGGYASCTSITSDWFGKFAMSWDGGGTSSNRLKDWLDPDNTGALTLNGYDPYGGVTITHTPLSDTKDTVNAYVVLCNIVSGSPLIPDSLKLRYQVLPSPVWFVDTLLSTGTNTYRGFIQPQSPGTTIRYRLFAYNSNGDADTSDLYMFNVVDYAVSLDPDTLAGWAAAYSTRWYSLTVTAAGNYDDNIGLAVTGNAWTTKIWDETQTTEISETGPLTAGESFYAKVSVQVPASSYGDYDEATVTGTSLNSPFVSSASVVRTTSAGQPLTVPFYDDFPSLTFSSTRWSQVSGATVSENGLNEPSGIYSANLNGDPVGADTLVTYPIDLSGLSGIHVTYFYERGGAGDSPESGDDLFVDYLNSSSHWVVLEQHLGGAPSMNNFSLVDVALTPDAYHAAFQLRFRSVCSAGEFDDWFVDDVRVDYAAQVAVSPESYATSVVKGDSTQDLLVVADTGAATLVYSVVVSQDAKLAAWLSVSPAEGQIDSGKADTLAVMFTAEELDSGTYTASIQILSNDPDPDENPMIIPVVLQVGPPPPPYVCGDADGDEVVNIADAIYIITYIFGGGSAPTPAASGDVDCSGVVNIADVTYLINYIFGGGLQPCSACP